MPLQRSLDEQAFDQWLRISLRDSHGDLVDEPIPEDMLRLLQELN